MSRLIIPVILCGGSGTRLWPASREQHPKQFLSLVGEHSLLQNTALRAMSVAGSRPEHIVTVTLGALADKVREQLAGVDPRAAEHILPEPAARNTAAAVAYAAVYVARVFGPDALMWVLPADHYMEDEGAMAKALETAIRASEDGFLVTFGINPTRPETGYGYIRLGKAFDQGAAAYHADTFVEKPDAETAGAYLADGNYLWNSGMFLFLVATLLDEYTSHAVDILDKVQRALGDGNVFPEEQNDAYRAIPEAPFDKAIMEKSSRVAIVPCDPGWSDIGSWESLWELREKDNHGNAVAGNAVLHGAKDCLIQAQNRLVACAGVKDIIVIDTGDALLVANRSDAESMRALVKALKGAGHPELIQSVPASWTAEAPVQAVAGLRQ